MTNIIKCLFDIPYDEYNTEILNNSQSCQKEIINKVQIIINRKEINNISKYKFHKKGIYEVKIKEIETIKDMSYMFSGIGNLISIDLSNFNFVNVINMSYMFDKCSSLQKVNLSNFKADSLSNMSYMFNECYSLKVIKLSNFKVDNIINMSYMFNECKKLEEIKLSNFRVNKLKDMSYMFNPFSL